MNKAVVPISGGIDSTVLLYHAVKCGKFDEVHAISFNYGQRHSKELDYAKETTKQLDVNHKIIDLSFFKHINSSSLTNPDIDVAKTRDVLGDAQTVNYVPFRNQMLLSICSAIAESLEANTVFHGAAQVDTQAGYWDGSEEFVDVVNNVTDLNRENRIVIEAPLLEMSKAEINRSMIRLLKFTNSGPTNLISQFGKFLEISKDHNLPRMMSIQNPYSLLNRTYEIGLAEISIREKIGLLAYSPLASGYLTGKYRNNQLPKNSRLERDGEFWTRYNKPNTFKAVDAYFEIAKKHNLNFAQMSLKFCEIQPFVTSVIIGATKMDQLKTDIESVNIKLSEEVIKEINEVQKIYPNPCP